MRQSGHSGWRSITSAFTKPPAPARGNFARRTRWCCIISAKFFLDFNQTRTRCMSKHLLALLVLCLFAPTAANPIAAQQSADDLNSIFKAVKWRSIGPFRGGRSVCGTGVVGDPKTYYMGTTGGGLWKTDDMGLSWRNVSDGYFKTGSVSALGVGDSEPD